MKPVIDILDDRISGAMAAAVNQKHCLAMVCPSTDPQFGDYQANGVMALGKRFKRNPRELAEEVVKNLDVSDICEQPEVAGPGFINLRLKPQFIADRLLEINKNITNLGIDKTDVPKTVVVDFSGPNIAKQMHVGHLRSTIIGDCICRLLEFQGHKVIRQNHIGDWGTQFGKILYVVNELGRRQDYTNITFGLNTLEKLYQKANQLEKTDPNIALQMRDWTFQLQRGNTIAKSFWKISCDVTLKECYEIYKILSVNLNSTHTRGESEYRDELAGIVEDLLNRKIARKSDNAVCVFPEGFKNKEGEPLPFIIQKSDGAYLYATTDLAAIRYRINKLKADKIIYVTDARQKLHFEMLFAVARMAGWVSDDIELMHVTFGSVLGEDGTPLKTRSGENVKLKELLDEAIERAKNIVEGKNPELSAERKVQIAKAVGLGAVKYADFSNNRTSDYIFSFEKMLAMDGNTAPYMQYAYARIKSIERKAQSRDVDIETELANLKTLKTLSLDEPAEIDLAKQLSRYGEAVEAAAADYRPNYLTGYLYELAQKFSVFYTNCPVLKAGREKRGTRLLLCDLTAKTIKHGLSELLGIDVVEQM